jgi:hypothetical protein
MGPGPIRGDSYRLRAHRRSGRRWRGDPWHDAESGKYTSHFFDSQGHVTVDQLIYDDGKWIWSGERIRTTSEFSEDGKIQRSLHEQTEDGVEWRLAIDVTLRKVE